MSTKRNRQMEQVVASKIAAVLSIRQDFKRMPASNRSTAKKTSLFLQSMDHSFVSNVCNLSSQLSPDNKKEHRQRVAAVRSTYDDILRQHAQNIERHFEHWKEVHLAWHKQLDDMRADIQSFTTELVQLAEAMQKWHSLFLKAFNCLPTEIRKESGMIWHEDRVLHHLGKWYEASTSCEGLEISPLAIVKRHVQGLNKLCLQIPNHQFNQILPPLEIPQQALQLMGELPTCDLCGEAAPFSFPCSTCINKTTCYSCIRLQVWAAHHDSYRVLSQNRTVCCGFCNQPIDTSTILDRLVMGNAPATSDCCPEPQSPSAVCEKYHFEK
jgi:hypothetical protein